VDAPLGAAGRDLGMELRRSKLVRLETRDGGRGYRQATVAPMGAEFARDLVVREKGHDAVQDVLLSFALQEQREK
jgi:hypothetical protein